MPCAHATPCCVQFNLFKDWEQAKKQASQVLGVAQAKAYEAVEEVSTSTEAADISTLTFRAANPHVWWSVVSPVHAVRA